MNIRSQFFREIRATLVLAFPLIIGELSQMALGVADTIMIGQVGVVELAASAFVNSVLHLPLMLGFGLLIGVSVRVSQARGEGNPVAARSALRNGLYLGLGIGLLTILGAFVVVPRLHWFGQDPEVVAASPRYFYLVAVSLLPALMAIAIKAHADAMNRPWMPFWIIGAGVVLNIFLNWLLIYGSWGFPEWGLEGAGIATALSRFATLVVIFLWCLRAAPDYREWLPVRWFRGPEWGTMRSLLQIGIPSSIHLLAEVGAFVMAALLVGRLGATALASHQIALTCAATTFMVPLGIGMAQTVRVGEAYGAKQPERLRLIALGGTLLVVLFALTSASSFVAFRWELAGLFSDDAGVIALCAHLLVITAVFQLFDGLQISASTSLRGMNDVRFPAALAFGVYWMIALPLGAVLAFWLHWGAAGIWWGITLGMMISAVVLSRRLVQKMRGVSRELLTSHGEG
ncbi:MATE family efflux transporter [Puniceicoccus vermicola]|uniref:Multidrug-efflux transporter n=1 Tax=Puniceicoccus vermicola TaxID=388746 RepID=A0A7X1E5U8_9BACT|nr:MATE family efflux transporter [Puniceicoccus vermicola]MBC2603438.1 MATE family efflux transporter [Puniceicoccus vermicola]